MEVSDRKFFVLMVSGEDPVDVVTDTKDEVIKEAAEFLEENDVEIRQIDLEDWKVKEVPWKDVAVKLARG